MMVNLSYADIITAVGHLLHARTPFALLSLPGSDAIALYADISDWSDAKFNESRFYARPFGEKLSVDTDYFLSGVDEPGTLIKENREICYAAKPSLYGGIDSVALSKEQYVESVSRIISGLKTSGGKTVFSRVKFIPASFPDYAAIASLIVNIISSDSGAFGYCYYDRQYGLWVGLSPEKLLEADLADETFSTVALAGTRSASDESDWDSKNVNEQKFVVNHIARSLEGCGADFNICPAISLKAGNVTHICNRISGNLCGHSPQEILNAINPTPAICGCPTDRALEMIKRYEPSSRSLYGGVLCCAHDTKFIAYLNLRCMKITGDGFFIYAGGGITAESDALTEWNETELKMQTMLRFTTADIVLPTDTKSRFDNKC